MQTAADIRQRIIVLLLFTAGTLIVFYDPLKEVFALSLRSELYSHIPMIPLMCGYLLYTRRRELFLDTSYYLRTGIPLIIAGSILYLIGRNQGSSLSHNDFLSIMVFSAVVSWMGGFK